MDVEEAARRVVRRHLLVVVLVVILALAAVVAVDVGRSPVYEAFATVSATVEAPMTPVQGQAVADRVQSFATLASVAGLAIAKAGVDRDPVKLALEDISVNRVGGSTIVRIGVRDEDARTAAAIADALSAEVVRRMDPRSDPALIDRDRALAADEMRLRAERVSLVTTVLLPDLLRRQLDAVDRTLASTTEARARLQLEILLRPRATVLERPAVPVTPAPTRLGLDLVLGGLLGLVAGLAAATTAEILRPGVTGLRSVAAALSVPAIGMIPVRGRDTDGVARRLRLLAATRGAKTVVVVPVGLDADHEAHVMRLALSVAADTPGQLMPVGLSSAMGRPLLGGVQLLAPVAVMTLGAANPLRICSLSALQPDVIKDAVAVAITPLSVRQTELDRMLDTCAASGVTLVGVMGRQRRTRVRKRKST